MQKRLIGCVILLLISVSAAFAHVRLSRLHVNSAPQQVQLQFDATGPLSQRHFLLHNPERLVIDIPNVQSKPTFSSAMLFGTPVESIRAGIHQGNTLRLVLDLTKPVRYHVFVMRPAGKKGYRLAINLFPHANNVASFSWPFQQKKQTHAVNQKPIAKTAEKKPAIRYNVIKPYHPKPVVSVKSEPLQKQRDLIVVIDPGHGGKDPGATGRRGTHEKNVVLPIGLDLQRLLNNTPGFKAVLTRSGDYYLTLRQRLGIARKYKADMYISIHADAFHRRSASGASVFALSSRGATSEAARWLAQRENESELMGGVKLTDKSNMLRSVLINLSQTATIRASLQIGGDIIQSLKKVTPLHHDRVEQAAFVVLKSPDIPSLLVESGFLSNPREEMKLRSPRYRMRLAQALRTGIKTYFVSHPPRGTWLAYWRSHPKSRLMAYRVRRGDTLSALALRYNVSIAQLKKWNHLSNNQLHIGQRISVPG